MCVKANYCQSSHIVMSGEYTLDESISGELDTYNLAVGFIGVAVYTRTSVMVFVGFSYTTVFFRYVFGLTYKLVFSRVRGFGFVGECGGGVCGFVGRIYWFCRYVYQKYATGSHVLAVAKTRY